MKWNTSYSVDVTEIDEQHKRLFALVNDLHHAMLAKQDRDLARIIDAVVDYTDYHFKSEEELLHACEYPEFDEHKEMHDSLTRRARSMKEAYESGNMPSAIEVLLLLANWLNRHILDEDRKYKSCIQASALHEKGHA